MTDARLHPGRHGLNMTAMTFADWHELAPDVAARTLLARVAALPSAQQRACIASLPDEATLTARFAAADRQAPFGAIPYFTKDLFDVAGEPTRAGSTFLPEVRPTPARDSALGQRLTALGAVLAGKTHLHEFAYGLTGENPHYGDCEHPHFPERTTGGSSSGSVALVSAGVVPFATGTDTGGSVRVPAAFCGIYGFRLTPRDTWISDAFPLAPTFDTAGWFTRNAADMRHVLGALIGWRESSREPRGVYLEPPVLDEKVALACRDAAISRFAAPAPADMAADLLAAFAGSAEAYAVIQSSEAHAIHREWMEPFKSRYDPAVWARLDRGHRWTDEQQTKARTTLTTVRLKLTQLFLSCDFLVMPATPCAALTKADCNQRNRERLLALTAPGSLSGLPILTVPVPLASGLTAGLQIVVNHTQSPVLPWALRR
jgi:aspartyl-tRNA(Asn)/glutamyl-tRNA(Gln) amidotransferase subunit A